MREAIEEGALKIPSNRTGARSAQTSTPGPLARWARLIPALVVAGLARGPGRASAQVGVEVALGSALNAQTPLIVNQDGFPQIRHSARYVTRPLSHSPYYQIQVGFWRAERTKAWLVGFLHHKLYLDNPPPEIEYFEITFGYNTLYGGHAWRGGKWVVSVGAGLLLANPNTEIRGMSDDRRRTFPDFRLDPAGATIFGGLQRRLPVAGKFFLAAGTKLTASMGWVPVSGGNARVPNLALHFQLSAGFGP